MFPPTLRIDNKQRCAVTLLYDMFLAVIPLISRGTIGDTFGLLDEDIDMV